MLPLYFAAAGLSWLLCGDTGAWNVFERTAGLADGNYTDRPLRWRLDKGRPGEHLVHLAALPVADQPDMPD